MVVLELYDQINLGISGAVKWLTVRGENGKIAAEGVVSMPHTARPNAWSTPQAATLEKGRYTLELRDFYNMSYLSSNAGYNDTGGQGGAVNTVDLSAVVVSRREVLTAVQ